MGDLLATLKRVRFVLFGDESGPGPNAPCIGDTLWADSGATLQDYIDDAIDRHSTLPLPLGANSPQAHSPQDDTLKGIDP